MDEPWKQYILDCCIWSTGGQVPVTTIEVVCHQFFEMVVDKYDPYKFYTLIVLVSPDSPFSYIALDYRDKLISDFSLNTLTHPSSQISSDQLQSDQLQKMCDIANTYLIHLESNQPASWGDDNLEFKAYQTPRWWSDGDVELYYNAYQAVMAYFQDLELTQEAKAAIVATYPGLVSTLTPLKEISIKHLDLLAYL